jgi:hypothetical protein
MATAARTKDNHSSDIQVASNPVGPQLPTA